MDTGLMQRQSNRTTSKRNEVLEAFRAVLDPHVMEPQTLEQKLNALTDTQKQSLLQTAKMIQMAMAVKVAAGDYSMGYSDLLAQMYGRMDLAKQQLIAELLDETAPLDFVPQPKQQREAQQDALGLYQRPEYQMPSQSELTTDDVSASALEAVLADAIPEPQRMQADELSFIKRLTQSESRGDSNAEIIIEDGRRYVGALQFGDARLQDYKKATGSSFTQDEFKADNALQDKVAAWHVADIDKAIDGLGLNTDGFNRDGLRAVAHLGGKSGMKKFVQSGGKYNPSDELGTSLQDYYDKFTS
ncbi:hypothetical protein OAH73_05675, partial [Planktomarina sp.]